VSVATIHDYLVDFYDFWRSTTTNLFLSARRKLAKDLGCSRSAQSECQKPQQLPKSCFYLVCNPRTKRFCSKLQIQQVCS
jgi:hypothetical protein